MLNTGISEGGRPVGDLLDAEQERTDVAVLGLQVALVGKDPFVKQRHQVNVVGQSPPKLLHRVDVRINKPG